MTTDGIPPAAGAGRSRVLLAAACVGGLAVHLWLVAWVLLPVAVMGWQPAVIVSDSMAPKIRTGDVVLNGPFDPSAVVPGTVVTFHDAGRAGSLVTHRIIEVAADGSYVTKGDANHGPDSAPVAHGTVAGTGRLLVPLVGLPAAWARSGDWLPVTLWAAATSVLVVVSLGGMRRRRPDKAARSPVAPLCVGLATALMVSAWTPSTAAWAATSENRDSLVSASTLQPASSLSASHRCTLLLGVLTDFWVDLSWTASSSSYASGYRVLRSTDGQSFDQVATVTPGTADTYRDRSVATNTSYHYRVQAYAFGKWVSVPTSEVTIRTRSALCL